MKTKYTLFTLLIVSSLLSCAMPNYLPEPENIDVNAYGSYIKLKRLDSANVKGELIAIDSSQIVVLDTYEKKCVSVRPDEVIKLSLRYAKPKNYAWTIPAFTLSTIIHGRLALISAPVNLIVTSGVTLSGHNAFKYKEKEMSYNDLKMFARFPRGIPKHIKLDDIEYTEKVYSDIAGASEQ